MHPQLKMNSAPAEICSIERTTKMGFTEGSWNREISRFALTTLASPCLSEGSIALWANIEQG